MKKKLFSFSFMLCLSCIATSYANPLSLMGNTTIREITRPATKKLLLLHYVHEQTLDLSNGMLEDKDMPAVIAFLNKNPQITSLKI